MEASEFLLFGFCSSFFSPPTQTSDADETYEYCTSTILVKSVVTRVMTSDDSFVCSRECF